MKYPSIKRIQDDLAPGLHDWYRCYKCSRIITREEEHIRLAVFNTMAEDATGFCKCGSLKIYPLNKPVRTEWLHPNVMRYTLKMVLARGLAPWCEKHFAVALPLIEWLVKP